MLCSTSIESKARTKYEWGSPQRLYGMDLSSSAVFDFVSSQDNTMYGSKSERFTVEIPLDSSVDVFYPYVKLDLIGLNASVHPLSGDSNTATMNIEKIEIVSSSGESVSLTNGQDLQSAVFDISKIIESYGDACLCDIFVIRVSGSYTVWTDSMKLQGIMRYYDGILNREVGVSFEAVRLYQSKTSKEVEEITTQKPGSFVEQEDGSFQWQEGEEVKEEVSETEVQGGILSTLANLPKKLFDMVLGLFIPKPAEMSELFNEFMTFMEDTFGFLFAPFEYFSVLVNKLMSNYNYTVLKLPSFSIMGFEVWGTQSFNLKSIPLVVQIFEYVRMGTGVLLSGWFLMYLQSFFKERFGKG